MNASSLTELWCALGGHPALRSHANAAHTTHRRDQLAICGGKERERVIRQGRQSHSTGPQHAVSKSNNRGPFALTSQFAVCGLP